MLDFVAIKIRHDGTVEWMQVETDEEITEPITFKNFMPDTVWEPCR